jgi:hypothetical protein
MIALIVSSFAALALSFNSVRSEGTIDGSVGMSWIIFLFIYSIHSIIHSMSRTNETEARFIRGNSYNCCHRTYCHCLALTRPTFNNVNQKLEYLVKDEVHGNKLIKNCVLIAKKGNGSFTWSGAVGIAN